MEGKITSITRHDGLGSEQVTAHRDNYTLQIDGSTTTSTSPINNDYVACQNQCFSASHTTKTVACSIPKILKVTVVLSIINVLLIATVGVLTVLNVHHFSFKLLIHSMQLKNPITIITILLVPTALIALALIALGSILMYKFVTRPVTSLEESHIEPSYLPKQGDVSMPKQGDVSMPKQENHIESPSLREHYVGVVYSSAVQDRELAKNIMKSFLSKTSYLEIGESTKIQLFKHNKLANTCITDNMSASYFGFKNELHIMLKGETHVLLLNSTQLHKYHTKMGSTLTGRLIFDLIAGALSGAKSSDHLESAIYMLLSDQLSLDGVNQGRYGDFADMLCCNIAHEIAGVFISEFNKLLSIMYSNGPAMLTLEVFSNFIHHIKNMSESIIAQQFNNFLENIENIYVSFPQLSMPKYLDSQSKRAKLPIPTISNDLLTLLTVISTNLMELLIEFNQLLEDGYIETTYNHTQESTREAGMTAVLTITQVESDTTLSMTKQGNFGLSMTEEDDCTSSMTKQGNFGLSMTEEDDCTLSMTKQGNFGLSMTEEDDCTLSMTKQGNFGLSMTEEDDCTSSMTKQGNFGLSMTEEDDCTLSMPKQGLLLIK